MLKLVEMENFVDSVVIGGTAMEGVLRAFGEMQKILEMLQMADLEGKADSAMAELVAVA